MDKSPEAFRTISEVAEALETPAHVLRFWESRFPQIKPVKRAGGRRYYRPSDVALLAGIKRLLHEEGLTIRGVQKILREQGIRHVSGLAEDSHAEDLTEDATLLSIEVEDTDPPLEAVVIALKPAAAPPAPPPAAAPPEGAQFSLFDPPVPVAPEPVAPEPETAVAGTEAAPEAASEPEPAPDASAPVPPAIAARVRRMAESATEPETPTPTIAARLRALPRGSLMHKAAPLAEIAARLAALRGRLAAPHTL